MKRQNVKNWYIQGILTVACLFLLAVIHLLSKSVTESEADDVLAFHSDSASRRLLSLPNCTPRAIEQFPRDIFTKDQRHQGAVLIHVIVAFYMFLGFAILCDDYFVPSLEVICKVLNIQSDVAGATFMAAGSSAPELATAVIAVFVAKDDIGVGTVVGSAVYNVLFVLSICALFAGMVVNLNWWPLFRDCLSYTVCVGALACVMVDEKIFWYEALAFLVLYLLYILLMYHNSSIGSWLVPKLSCCTNHLHIPESETIVLYETPVKNGSVQQNGPTQLVNSTDGWEYGSDVELSDEDHDTDKLLEKPEKEIYKQEQEEPESVFSYPDIWWKKILYFICFPLKVLFYITIPDCRHHKWQRCFIVTFIMCLVWLSILSYIMVWMITIVGFTAGIADSIMALTFVAFGVSMPDVISSLIVVRQGLLYATLTLLVTILFLLIATHINGWRLTRKYGVILLIVYLFFTSLTAMYELNIFGYFHPVECPTNY